MAGVSVTIEWDAVDVARLRERLKDKRTRMGRMTQLCADPVEEFVVRYGRLVAEEARKRIPKDTGRLRNSVRVRWVGYEVRVQAETPYAGYVDLGTKPHWPPVRALRGWAKRHNASAFAVAAKIARWGTEGVHFISGALKESEKHMPRFLRDTASKVAYEWGR